MMRLSLKEAICFNKLKEMHLSVSVLYSERGLEKSVGNDISRAENFALILV